MATVGSAIVCDRLRLYGNRSLCDRLRSAIVCDRLRSYGNQPLALLSVERFTAIKFPLRYRALVTHRRTLIASGTVWLWGIAVSTIPPLLISGDEETHVQIMEALTPCLHNSSRDNPAILRSNNVRAYLSFLLLALLVLPIATVIASYSYIIKVAYNQQKQIMNDESSSQAGQVTMKREMKAARTVAIVVGLCLASYTPLVVMLSIRVAPINPKTATPEKMFFTYLVASLNAVWNPVVYGWRNGNFRSSFKRLLKFGE
ncbi:adenosine receptor A2a-like [Acropora palmata]